MYRIHISSSLPFDLHGGYCAFPLLYGPPGAVGFGGPGKQKLHVLRDGQGTRNERMLGGHEELLPRRTQTRAKRSCAKAGAKLGGMEPDTGAGGYAPPGMEPAGDGRDDTGPACSEWAASGRKGSGIPAQL